MRLHEHLEAWVGASVPRGAPAALPVHLDKLLSQDYEHVNAEGVAMSRDELLGWWWEGR